MGLWSQLARINRLLERLEQEYEGLAAAVKVQKIILTIIFVAHFVACFWYMVGTEIEIQVSFQWKNPDFLSRNPDLLDLSRILISY